jgi:formylglycine-generating enzyme required for sulfatase activity
MVKPTIYTVGGTVQAGGIYIRRKADVELLELCRAGELSFILSSRQVGKSSLMTRTAQQLEKESIRSATIDLSSIGTKVTQDEWYLGILDIVATKLNLEADLFEWWNQYAGLGPAQKFFNFLRDVLLKEIQGNIVLFFDEIDTTLSIPFADDFFAALRAVYNARVTTSDFKRLSFVLIGVATPSDLISDSKRTPFNIGQRVDLNDFTLEEALPLAQGLGEQAEQALAWIFGWSGGHPYLTQRICAHLSKRIGAIDEQAVAQAVEDLFFGEQGQQDNNLQFVRAMLLQRSPDARRVMLTYRDIRAGKKIMDDEHSMIKAHLKISGVVNKQSGQLVTRNRIYERAFDLKWLQENTPSAVPRRIMLGSAITVAIALFVAAFFAYQEYSRTDEERAARFETNFRASSDPQVRLRNLAGMFELKDKSFGVQAKNLFSSLRQDEKLLLFRFVDSSRVQEDQVNVTLGIYQSLDNTLEGIEILRAMGNAMKTPNPNLANEINFWVEGREALNEKNYYDAKSALTNAIHWNPENPALYYDRAQISILLGQEAYRKALDDLARMIQLDPNRRAAARLLLDTDAAFSRYWKQNTGSYPALAEAIPPVVGIVDPAGVAMVLVPEGNFSMGSDTGEDDEKPIHTVYLDEFYIDKYEVTNKLYRACVDMRVCQPPLRTGSFTRASYYGNSQFDNYPVIYVDWDMAKNYCEWRGARLPTEAEWEKAARGTDRRIYPWGNTIECTNANYGDCVGDTTAVGSYESGISPYGVYDMAGNVWEWMADWYSESYYSSSPTSNPLGPDTGLSHVLRGCAWFDCINNVRSAYRYRDDPNLALFNVGFRCSRSLPLLSNETFVDDNLEGASPDFLTLAVGYNEERVNVTLTISGLQNLSGSEIIYMYGIHHDEIKLHTDGSFSLRRDNEADGHFEELIYSGKTETISDSSISINIPLEYLPDISIKKTWGYSLQSQDRIPNVEELLFPTPSQ